MTARRRAVLLIAATTLTLAVACTTPTITTTPSPPVTGSAQPTTPAVQEQPPSSPPPVAPPGVVRGVSPRPGSNDGLIVLTQRVCGTSKSWVSQAKANGIAGPDYVVLDSARLTIDCSLPAVAAPVSVPAKPPAASTNPQPAVTVASAGWVKPLTGRCDSTDEYGAPRYNPQTGQHYAHQGRDLPAPTGTPIHSVTAGQVISARDIGRGGLQVQIQSGNVTAKYNHLNGFAVHVGQHVNAGTVIGYVGSTGDATGPHLHLEIWVSGGLRNPTTFLASHGVRLGC